jgi:hypothetical protein
VPGTPIRASATGRDPIQTFNRPGSGPPATSESQAECRANRRPRRAAPTDERPRRAAPTSGPDERPRRAAPTSGPDRRAAPTGERPRPASGPDRRAAPTGERPRPASGPDERPRPRRPETWRPPSLSAPWRLRLAGCCRRRRRGACRLRRGPTVGRGHRRPLRSIRGHGVEGIGDGHVYPARSRCAASINT